MNSGIVLWPPFLLIHAKMAGAKANKKIENERRTEQKR